MASSTSPSSSTSSSSCRPALTRHAFVFLLGLLSAPLEQLVVLVTRGMSVVANFVEVAVGNGPYFDGSITPDARSMRFDVAALRSEPKCEGSGVHAVKSTVVEPAAGTFVSMFGTCAFIAILIFSTVDVGFNADLFLVVLAVAAEPAAVHQSIEFCGPGLLLLDANVKYNTDATGASAPLKRNSLALYHSVMEAFSSGGM